MNRFQVKTKNNSFQVEVYSKFISSSNIPLNKKKFNDMCKSGCVNYGKKYSCPPFVPEIKEIIKNSDGLFVVLFKCNLCQINSTEYNKVRIANAVMKSRTERLLRLIEKDLGVNFLGTGSCRLCKPCKLKLNLPCKYPDKRKYSLEALGVDCNKLSKSLFNIELKWYKIKKAPEYTCVICGLVCNKKQVREIEKFLIFHLNFDVQKLLESK